MQRQRQPAEQRHATKSKHPSRMPPISTKRNAHKGSGHLPPKVMDNANPMECVGTSLAARSPAPAEIPSIQTPMTTREASIQLMLGASAEAKLVIANRLSTRRGPAPIHAAGCNHHQGREQRRHQYRQRNHQASVPSGVSSVSACVLAGRPEALQSLQSSLPKSWHYLRRSMSTLGTEEISAAADERDTFW